MSTQYKDGKFSGVEEMPEAVDTLNKAIRDDNAAAFHVGEKAELEERIEALKEKLQKELSNPQSI